jgi:hypothetical protein
MPNATVITDENAILKMFEDAEKNYEKHTKECRVLQRLIKGNYENLLRLCSIKGIDGAKIDPGCCMPIDADVIRNVMKDFVIMLLEGIPFAQDLSEDKQSEIPCWKIGNMGSRWIDIDPRPYGLDYIRVAYYKNDGEFITEKPHIFKVQCEKSR